MERLLLHNAQQPSLHRTAAPSALDGPAETTQKTPERSEQRACTGGVSWACRCDASLVARFGTDLRHMQQVF